jgi:putative DNA primase/helicase
LDFIQCPAALAACSALSALSLAGQALVDVRRSEGLTGPVSLFVLAVAESGERKSSADGYFTSTIKTWQHERAIASKPDVAHGQAKLDEWEASREGIIAAIKSCAKGGKPTDELREKLERLEMDPPMPVLVPNLIYTDATPEALAFALSRKWPSGGVMSSEAGAVFGGHAMTSDSAMRNMAMLNALWDGGEVKIDRRTSESFAVRGARLTMGLAVQPETIRAFYEGSKGLARGIGFSARCLIAWPASTQGKRMFRPAPETMPAVGAFGKRLAQLLDETPAPDGAGQIERRMLGLSDEAHAVWRAFHDDVERELGHAGELIDVRDVASKAADNAARIAALFHLYESGAEGEVSAAHMRAAGAIMTWHLYEARRFYGEVALPKGLANAVKLDAWLLKQGEAHVPTRHVRQFGPNALRDARMFDEAMSILADAHRARIVEIGQKKVIQLNPALVGGPLEAAA